MARINPPVFSKTKGYERFKQELLAWDKVTDLDVKKRGITVLLTSIPDSEETGVKDGVFDNTELMTDLEKETGLAKLVQFLDKQLGKDDLADSLEKFEDFEAFKRESGQSVSEYISKFDFKYSKIAKLQMALPSPILAFMLLRKANITASEKLINHGLSG